MAPFMVFLFPVLVYMAMKQLIRAYYGTKEVKGKVVVITGASSGLGAACAKSFSKSGAKVVMCARNVEKMQEIKDDITNGDQRSEWPKIYGCDVTSPADVTDCVSKLLEDVGAVDILINNAGISQRASVIETEVNTHRKIMDVNYFGAVQFINEILPCMIEKNGGHVIAISSVQGRIAIPYRCAYSASKHALNAFCDSLRAEVAKHNISVSVINPGYIRTELSINALSGDGQKHGEMDSTTASGMHPSFVSESVLECARYPESEMMIADFSSNAGIYMRTLMPSLYFKYMSWRAEKEERRNERTKRLNNERKS